MLSAHVRSIYGLHILKPKHQSIRKIKRNDQLPTLHGHQVWQSSYMILDYLNEQPLESKQRIMDIGCGWGLLGIYCAKHFEGDVLMVDADDRVFPYVDSHQKLNDVRVKTANASFDELGYADFAKQDIILGSDICFWPKLVTQLRQLITTAMQASVKKIILADPGRATFLQLVEFCRENFHCKLIPWKLGGRSRNQGYLLIIDND